MIECVNITAKIALPTGDRPQSWFKQTLQLTDFIGTNENAVKWQIDMDRAPHAPPAALPQVPLRLGQGVLVPRRNRALCGMDGPRHRGDPSPLWDGITPAPTETALHPAVFGGLLTARI